MIQNASRKIQIEKSFVNSPLNCPVILLRNLNPTKGLCNGSRLVCRQLKSDAIYAEITVGHHKGKIVFKPRIPLLTSDNEKNGIPFKRTQFPVRLCFAMTSNKAQGQTLDSVFICATLFSLTANYMLCYPGLKLQVQLKS